eukprot:jgi/Ulvmu1/10934/UM007_0113.1
MLGVLRPASPGVLESGRSTASEQRSARWLRTETYRSAEMRFLKGDSAGVSRGEVDDASVGESHKRAAAQEGDAGAIISKARELNRISQTKYRQRLKAMAIELQGVLEERREALREARERRTQYTAENRRLHRRKTSATDALLNSIKSRSEPPPASAALGPAMAMSLQAYPSAACDAGMLPPPQRPDGPTSTAGDLEEPLATGGTRVAGSTADGATEQMDSGHAASAVVVVFVRLRPTDVLPPADAPANPPGAADSAQHAVPSGGAAVGPADVHDAEQVVQRIAVRLQALRRAAAAGSNAAVGDIRWLLGTPYSMPDGQRLAFSTARVSDECWASQHAFWLLIHLEAEFLAATTDPSAMLCSADMEPPTGEDAGPNAAAAARSGTATAAATAHSIERLLRDASDVSTTDLHVTCGGRERAPVAAFIPTVVRQLCEQYRGHLPQRAWARACWAYVEFVRALGRPEGSTEPCHHWRAARATGASAAEHDGVRCPRCCVLATVLRTLRECVTEVAQNTEVVKLQPLPLAGVQARSHELCACMSIMHAQGLHEAPADSRVVCYSMLDGSTSLTAEIPFMVKCFERLQLSHSQQVRLAAMWQMWRRSRRSYDSRLEAAMEPLSHLACSPPAPCATHAAHPAHGSAAFAPPSPAEHAASVCCECCACAMRMSKRLHGASMRVHSHSALALRRLRAFQEHDSACVAAVLQAVCMPGVLLSAEQITQQMQMSVEMQRPHPDWLQLCEMADEDLKRRSTFHALS